MRHLHGKCQQSGRQPFTGTFGRTEWAFPRETPRLLALPPQGAAFKSHRTPFPEPECLPSRGRGVAHDANEPCVPTPLAVSLPDGVPALLSTCGSRTRSPSGRAAVTCPPGEAGAGRRGRRGAGHGAL